MATAPQPNDPLNIVSPPNARWTIANTAEQMPGVLTPLTITMTTDEMDLELLQGFGKLGVLHPSQIKLPASRNDYTLGFFYGRCAVNVSELRKHFDLTPGTSGAAYEAQMFGNVGSDESLKLPRSRYPHVAVMMPLALLTTPRTLHSLRAEVQEWWARCVKRVEHETLPQARATLVEAEAKALKVGPYVWTSTMAAQLAFGRTMALANEAGLPELVTTVSGGYGTEEMDMANDLWAVSRGRITRDQFLATHGWTSPHGMELEQPSWRERPDLVDALISSYEQLPDSDDPALALKRRAAERQVAERQILNELPARKKAEAKVVLRILASYMRLRTIQKAAHAIPWDVERAAARRIGDLLVEQGVIDERDDVFQLTKEEVLAPAPPENAKELVARRRAQHEEYLKYTLPEVWTGNPEPIVIADQPAVEHGGSLTGMGVSPGVVEGTVRVVSSPTDADVQPGEILVCATTDPSWIGLMVVAAGMVIDVGGPVSHGAIVARELGVPCVIGTKIAVASLTTGDRVRVDGAAGTVEILDPVVAPA